MAFSKKLEDEADGLSFYQDKTSIIQEARIFNESPIHPRKCRMILTKIAYLLLAGEVFGRQEATTLFFGVTKLFQHKDPALRQMVYLVIKELSYMADDIIMVTSSIMKDMQGSAEVIYRSNAVRALARVIDPSMVQSVERALRSPMVDRQPSVSSAALVSAYHLQPLAREVVKRWANEAGEAVMIKPPPAQAPGQPGFGLAAAGYLNGQMGGQGTHVAQSMMTQYHGIGLLYLIRAQDRMAISKLIQQFSGSGKTPPLRNPLAMCMIIRYCHKIEEEDPNMHKQMYDILEICMRHRSEMVGLEAAKAICTMRYADRAELQRAMVVLQLFCSSPKTALKFAAVRIVASVAQRFPQIVQTINSDLEHLVTDPNRSVATYAITTLLKTGNETSVDRLMKTITGFMSELTDEFKVTVVDAIRSLCLKFPSKQGVMLSFLSGVLRDEGGFEFKRAAVEAIFDMIKFISNCKETALAYLCEFIEDCEFTKLSVRILHLLGVEGPKTPSPTKYIRYIYNRVILENAIVRAAAVSALAKFGVLVEDPGVRKSINVLLSRCLDDVDDEVRDRAAMSLRIMSDELMGERMIKDDSTFSLTALESSLLTYSQGSCQTQYDATDIPKISKEQARAETLKTRKEQFADNTLARPAVGAPVDPVSIMTVANGHGPETTTSHYEAVLKSISEFANYGNVLKSTDQPIELTEAESEYIVTCVKHVFKEHVVFQFNVTNTLEATILEQVSMLMTAQGEYELVEDFILPIPVMRAENNNSGSVYVSFTRPEDHYSVGNFTNVLKFTTKEVDPITGEPEEEGFEDEYETEAIELNAGDYIVPSYVTFAAEWDALKSASTFTETFSLASLNSLKEACDTIPPLLSMLPLGGSDTPSSTSVHTLNMSGIVAGGGGKVLVRARMTYASGEGVTMEMAVRAEQEGAVQLVVSAIA